MVVARRASARSFFPSFFLFLSSFPSFSRTLSGSLSRSRARSYLCTVSLIFFSFFLNFYFIYSLYLFLSLLRSMFFFPSLTKK